MFLTCCVPHISSSNRQEGKSPRQVRRVKRRTYLAPSAKESLGKLMAGLETSGGSKATGTTGGFSELFDWHELCDFDALDE